MIIVTNYKHKISKSYDHDHITYIILTSLRRYLSSPFSILCQHAFRATGQPHHPVVGMNTMRPGAPVRSVSKMLLVLFLQLWPFISHKYFKPHL